MLTYKKYFLNFYSENAICKAKSKLYETGVKLLNENVVGKLKERRADNDKKKLDKKICLSYSQNWTRIKLLCRYLLLHQSLRFQVIDRPTKCDVSVFASNLFDLKTNVEAMQCELAALKKNNDCVMGVKAIKDSSNINKSLMVIV